MSLLNKINGLKEVWQFENRFWLTLTKIFYPRETLIIYRYKNLEVLTDHSAGDANGAREILTSPMYRRFLPQMQFDTPINILDLGGNNGGFPLLLQSENFKLKKVVSIELNPKTFIRLRFNLERNLECEIVPINAAVCGESKTFEITLGKGSVSDSIYDDRRTADEHKLYSLRGVTVDEICAADFENETIDICKMDIEGAEFEVFEKLEHRSLSRCRYLIMEIHERGKRRKEEILPAIENLGFVRQTLPADADPTVHFFINAKFN